MGAYVEGTPHLSEDLLERPFAGFNLATEHLPSFGTTAMTIKEDMSCVLQEDCAIKIYERSSFSSGGRRRKTKAGLGSMRLDQKREDPLH